MLKKTKKHAAYDTDTHIYMCILYIGGSCNAPDW